MTDIFKPDDEVDFREKRGGMARAFDLLTSLPEILTWTLSNAKGTRRKSARGCDRACLGGTGAIVRRNDRDERCLVYN